MNALIKSCIASLVVLTGCGVDPCAGGGTATLELHYNVSGAKVVLTTPSGTTRTEDTVMDSKTLTGVPSGRWSVHGEAFANPGGLVRTAQVATADPATFCVAAGGTQSVTITWAQAPASAQLWALNANGAGTLSFAAADLGATGTVSPRTKGDSPFGHDVTFDRDGNLWSLGATTADATVVMTSHMTGTEKKTADRSITIDGLSCLPAAAGLAFDRSGNLWVSSPCSNKVYRLTPAQLAETGTVTPLVVLSGFQSPQGLAFDSAGNLFVADADAERILRFDPAALEISTSTPNVTIGIRASSTNPMDVSLLKPSWLAFDAAGNLWSDDFGGNIVFEVAKADLNVPASVQPVVKITLDVGALPEGLAFDDAGGLWVAFVHGQIARLAPAQLTTSSTATPPETVLTSADIGSAINLAFYPAAAGLPLAHAMP